MSTPQQETDFRETLIKIRDHVKERQATARLAATLAAVPGATSGPLATDIARMVDTNPMNDDPGKQAFVTVLLNAEGRAIVSAETQILIYHLYRLQYAHSQELDKEKGADICQEWNDYYEELAREIDRVDPWPVLRGTYGHKPRARQIVVEIIGRNVHQIT
jgi:hypothetical protein